MSNSINLNNPLNTQQSLIFRPLKPSLALESQFMEEVSQIHLVAHPFGDFLVPNELCPQNVKPHLDRMERGLIVSTGTERSFFDLALSDERKCTGLVIRDINPKVKAYTDFLILLLRISKGNKETSARKEFIWLSEPNENEEEKTQKLRIIEKRIRKSDMPEELKQYYLENLEALSSVYWENRDRNGFIFNASTTYDYWDKESSFKKLQRYARAGSIISTVGDINDLHFLSNFRVSIVDTSNIHNYIPLNLKGGETFQPRVIWTTLSNFEKDSPSFCYYSYMHQPLEEKEETELAQQLSPEKAKTFRYDVKNTKKAAANRFDTAPMNSYSKETLHELHTNQPREMWWVPGYDNIKRN